MCQPECFIRFSDMVFFGMFAKLLVIQTLIVYMWLERIYSMCSKASVKPHRPPTPEWICQVSMRETPVSVWHYQTNGVLSHIFSPLSFTEHRLLPFVKSCTGISFMRMAGGSWEAACQITYRSKGSFLNEKWNVYESWLDHITWFSKNLCGMQDCPIVS